MQVCLHVVMSTDLLLMPIIFFMRLIDFGFCCFCGIVFIVIGFIVIRVSVWPLLNVCVSLFAVVLGCALFVSLLAL